MDRVHSRLILGLLLASTLVTACSRPTEEPPPAVTYTPVSAPSPDPAPAPEPTAGSAPTTAPVEPPDTILLTEAPMGPVTLEHRLHAVDRKIPCDTCHHPSHPQKPLTHPQQSCRGCHTRTATPPMKTKLQAAFHDPAAKQGTCIGCHKLEIANGKKSPLKCTECHKKQAS